jgi:hypothetical protein
MAFERITPGSMPLVSRVEGATVALGVRAGARLVASLEAGLSGMFGTDLCTLVIGATRHALEGRVCETRDVDVSGDGRFVAVSVRANGRAEVRVYRTSDGSLAATHDGGVGSDPERSLDAGACFSHDGTSLVVSRADHTVFATTPEGADERPLGAGDCVGWSPDDRFVLIAQTSAEGAVSHRLVTVATWASEMLPEAHAMRFVPAVASE